MKLLSSTKTICYSICCIAAVLLQSCEKNDATIDSKLEIAFSSQTIDFSKVDSITATFSRIGQAPSFSRSLKHGIGTGTYYLEESELKEGAWYTIINIYTTEDQGSRRKYQLKKQFDNLFTTISAPVIKADDPWNPFIIMVDQTSKIELVMPERQDNSAFELTIPAAKTWNYLAVERVSFTNIGLVVAAVNWSATDNIVGKINNSTALFDYTESLKTKKWYSTAIRVKVSNTHTNEDSFLYYTYVNRYTPMNI
jgi:hypothetical protein